ncbi:hypothetical protein [Longimicrobium sp.]|uniref:hypothetical protein n=1 Tax=Longimicrobium sp. TaxID=2029185 RepID=UPI002E307AF1|nr:hypothetical protein [Longimicrobium sp.]HEX6040408.1 hypothetical protein [Longimicrobium sp.]
MKTKMRWMAGIAALLVSAAACEQSLVAPDADASLGRMDLGGLPPDTINGDTGYFGSGHVDPPPPVTDSIKGGETPQ